MAIGELQHRRGNTSTILGITPKDGEILINTVTGKPSIGNGVIAGGILVDGNDIKSVTSGSYSLAEGDAGKLLVFNSSSAIAVNLASPGGIPFPSQSKVYVLNIGAGVVTFTPTGVSVNGLTSVSLEQYAGGSISTDGTDYFAVFGSVALGATTLNMVTKTSDYTLLTNDSGKHFDNTGASVDIVLSLPVAARGLVYTGTIVAAHYITFQTNGTNRVSYQGNNSASGGFVRSSDQLSTITLKAISSSQWVTNNSDGSWGIDI